MCFQILILPYCSSKRLYQFTLQPAMYVDQISDSHYVVTCFAQSYRRKKYLMVFVL